MRPRLLLAGVAVVIAAAAAVPLLAARLAGGEALPEAPGDPAYAYYTSAHGAGYGGIDRWATYGMPVELLTGALHRAGYQCQLPREQVDVQPVSCSKRMAWPERTLTIHASIDYGMRGRLVSAVARSDIDGAWGQRIGAWMRGRGWLEPQSLRVRGFGYDSVDLLAYAAADAIRAGGWHEHCADGLALSDCPGMAQARRAQGFSVLPEGALAVGGAADVMRRMERVRLMPLAVRGADKKPGDSLQVRVAGARMWLDFAGRDLAGREAKVSVALDSAGGVPVELVASLDGESRSVPLAGTPRADNGGLKMLLLPEAGEGGPVFANWLVMPNENYPATYAKLAPALAQVHPAFRGAAVKAVLGKALQLDRPEDNLGLYPALHSIEERAAVLRRAGVADWLPLDGMAGQEPALRAAFALALCPPDAPSACLQRLAQSDPEAAGMLREAVAAQSAAYAALAADHPVRTHLKRLESAL